MSKNFSIRNRAVAVPVALAIALGAGTLASCSSADAERPAARASTVVTHDTPVNAGDMDMDMDMDGSHGAAVETRQTKLYTAMRTLWDQHMQWTWDAVVAFASGSPGTDATINRLLANQDDIGNAVKPFYGKAAAAKITSLLRTHINDAVPVLQAAKAGDKVALDQAVDAWYANAAEIGRFLASANPAGAKQDMPGMMKEHITQTVAYASSVLAGDWPKVISQYGEAQAHMDQMADMLSAGIITQFPKKF